MMRKRTRLSACFFDSVSGKPAHATFNLYRMPHPHSGAAIAEVLESCLQEWEINPSKVQLIITDNSTIIVKAIKILHDKETLKLQTETVTDDDRLSQTEDEDSDGENGDNDNSQMETEADDEENNEEDVVSVSDTGESIDLPDAVPYRRMPCMAHTLQLVIKIAYQKNYKGIITKARHLVGQIRKSSVIVEKLVERSGKNVVSDCSTRWNSTFLMAKRLLEIKNHVNDLLGEAGIDTLVASEWAKLDEMASLLEPFAFHTDILQTDYQSMSYILPSLLDLECHLLQFPSAKTATTQRSLHVSRLSGNMYQLHLYHHRHQHTHTHTV